MSSKPLASEKHEYSSLKEGTTSLYKLFCLWCTFVSGLLAIIQMAYGIFLVLFFFFSFDANYEKWEIPGSLVILMVFTGFIVQASALLVIIGHIQRNAKYVYMGCVFPFLECSRTSFIMIKRVYEGFFEDSARVMSEQKWINSFNIVFFIGVLAWFFFISLVFHCKTASIIEKNEGNDE